MSQVSGGSGGSSNTKVHRHTPSRTSTRSSLPHSGHTATRVEGTGTPFEVPYTWMLETDGGSAPDPARSSPNPHVIDFEERSRRRARWLLAIAVTVLVLMIVASVRFAPTADAGGSCGGG